MPKKPTRSKSRRADNPAVPDPTTDDSLRALDPSYARSPDIPVDVATREDASLARLAASLSAPLAKIGITGSMTANLAAFARRLAAPALLGKGPRGYQA